MRLSLVLLVLSAACSGDASKDTDPADTADTGDSGAGDSDTADSDTSGTDTGDSDTADSDTGESGAVDADGDGYAGAADCDDTLASVNPDATERCNGRDDNCDGTIDEPGAADAPIWYEDYDADTYGDPDAHLVACEGPAGYVADASDCDDSNPDIHPGAEDVCDGIDTNCDGTADDTVPTWYSDADGDGYGDARTSLTACSVPSSYVLDGSDCDDRNPDVNPGAAEVCDRLDNNCDGIADDSTSVDAGTWYADADGDSFGDPALVTVSCIQPSRSVTNGDDCDDTNRTTNPLAPEYCDGVDNNCDGSVDEGAAVDATLWYVDTDGDGFGDTAGPRVACDQPRHYAPVGTDCDDTDELVNPGAPERCNGVDDDCNGVVDEGAAVDGSIWYADADADGFGDPAAHVVTCVVLDGYVADATDCDDTSAATWPGATEVCDEADNNCDGAADEGLPTYTWYVDADTDGWGDDAAATTEACAPPDGYGEAGDCDDTTATTNPDAFDYCGDGVDSDCSGSDCVYAHVGNDFALETVASATGNILAGPRVVVPTDTTVFKLATLLPTGGSMVEMALYSSVGVTVGPLVAYTAPTMTGAGANEIDVVTPTRIAAGTYWLMADYDRDTDVYLTFTSTNASAFMNLTASSPPPVDFGDPEFFFNEGVDQSYYLVVSP